MAVTLAPRAKAGIILSLALLVLWQVWIGSARPGAVASPAGEAGLCLALVAWWWGAGVASSLMLWGGSLIGSALVCGVAPIWAFLLGWPAWMLVRSLAAGKGPLAFLLLAATLVSAFRCGGKLLFLAWPQTGFPLTLSGVGLLGSLWAEVAPNLAWLWAFWLLLGGFGEGSQKAVR